METQTIMSQGILQTDQLKKDNYSQSEYFWE